LTPAQIEGTWNDSAANGKGLASLVFQPSYQQHCKRLRRSTKTRNIKHDQYATIVLGSQVTENKNHSPKSAKASGSGGLC
jgi:hypothetical protein